MHCTHINICPTTPHIVVTLQIKKIDSGENNISSARIHKYGSPLEVEDIEKTCISSPEEVIVKVGAAGLCHSDLHLINGDWQKNCQLILPKTPGHEIAGWVEETGNSVPEEYQKGDLVVVFGGWGCGFCFLL